MSKSFDFDSWEEVREHLALGETVNVHIWCFSRHYMSCSDGCCDDNFKDVDEALESVRSYAHNLKGVEKC